MPLIRTTINPGVEVEVSGAEYERLLDLGLIYDGTPPVVPVDAFDARMADRIDDPESLARGALEAWGGGGGGGGGAVSSVNGETGAVVLDTDDIAATATRLWMTSAERTKLTGVASGATANSTDVTLLARANHTGTQTLDTTTDTGTRVAMTPAERTKLTGVATAATANSTDATLLARANHTGTQAAATISDLTETVQDIVGALIVAGVNTTVSYDDVANTFTINSTGGSGGATDPEIVRDVIGAAMVAGAGIQVLYNDATDTITISSTAVLPTRTISTTAPLTGGGDLSANRTLGISVGTSAGTVAAGDDGRLSDQRVPTDASVTVPKLSAAVAGRLPLLFDRLRVEGKLPLPSSSVLASPVAVGSAEVTLPKLGTHAAFPGLVLLPDGRHLAVWRDAGHHLPLSAGGNGNLYGSYSSDGMRTWTAPHLILNDALDARDPNITVSADGSKVWLSYFTHDGTIYKPFVRTSTDGGATFGAAAAVGAALYVLATASPIVELGDGTLRMFAYGKNASGDARESIWVSTRAAAEGSAWSAPTKILDGVVAGRDYQEPYCIVDGATLRVFMRYGNNDGIGQITSTNNGSTWSAVTRLFSGSGRAVPIRLSSGPLVVLYRDTTTSPRDGVYRVSTDDGATWGAETLLRASFEHAYAAAVETARGVVAVLAASEDSGQAVSTIAAIYLIHGGATTPIGDNTLGVSTIRRQPVDAKTAAYQLGVADEEKLLTVNTAATAAVTIPTNATAAIPVGAWVEILQLGAGQTTITAASGVTLRLPPSSTAAVRGQYGRVVVQKIGTDEWAAAGDLATT